MRKRFTALVTVFVAMTTASTAAFAVGAIAIGVPANVVADGLAIGIAYGQPSPDAASALALKNCRSFQDAPESTRNLCRIVHTFRKQCVSVSLDPKAGTPGWGWAVAASERDADEQSMRMCRSTAGSDRERYCEVTRTQCDVGP